MNKLFGNQGKMFTEVDKASLDVNNEKIDKLKELFPNIVSDGKIDWETLKLVLGDKVTEDNERYKFTWNGKNKAIRESSIPSMDTLRPDKESSKNWDTTENLYIEGDNLEVLKILQNSYNGKIKMIYIDPPYNTGNDFIYEDDFTISGREAEKQEGLKDKKGVTQTIDRLARNSKDSAKYHTKWLNMMYPRLSIARDLLTDDGVIFISIDDNEVHNLRKICDEIFGENNLLTTFTTKVRYEGKTLVEDMDFQKLVENVLVYSKLKKNVKLKKESIEYNFDKFQWEIKEIGQPEVLELGGKRVEIFKSGTYQIIKQKPRKDLLKEIWASGTILDGNSSGRFFRDYFTGRDKIDGLGTLYKVEGIGDDHLPFRYFTGPKREGATKGKYYQGIPKGIRENPDDTDKNKPIITFLDLAGSFGNCRHEGNVDFRNGKKPLKFFQEIFKMIDIGSGDIVLDFFSGSSSTAHSILERNLKENKSTKFIMVQVQELTYEGKKDKNGKYIIDLNSGFPEIKKDSEARKLGFNYITEIGRKRISNAGEKIIADNPEKDLSMLDIGFKTFKLDSSNFNEWDTSYESMMKSIKASANSNYTTYKEERESLDLVYEILLKEGHQLTETIEEITIGSDIIYKIADGVIYIFLGKLTDEIIEKIVEMKKEAYDLVGLDNPSVVLNEAYLDTGIKANAKKNFESNGIIDIKTL